MHALKNGIARLLCSPIVGRLLGCIFGELIPSRGLWIATSEVIDPTAKASLFWGLYESAESRYVSRYLRSDIDVIEFGSSIGVISSQIARSVSDPYRLVCVEANPKLIPLLVANVARNAPKCRAQFVHGAVCLQANEECTFLEGKTHQVSRVISVGEEPCTNCFKVSTVTLQSLLDRFHVSRYALVCDIEGGEVPVILMAGALAGCEQLIIELHETDYNGRTYLVDELCQAVSRLHDMKLVDRYHCVCYFERC